MRRFGFSLGSTFSVTGNLLPAEHGVGLGHRQKRRRKGLDVIEKPSDWNENFPTRLQRQYARMRGGESMYDQRPRDVHAEWALLIERTPATEYGERNLDPKRQFHAPRLTLPPCEPITYQ